MNKTLRPYIVCICCVLALLLSQCAVQQSNMKAPVQNEYEYDSSSLHPLSYIYHFSDDSTRIYYALKKNEVLYARSNTDSPFFTNIEFHYRLYSRSSELKTFVDSASFIFKEANDKNDDPWIRGSFDIPMEQNLDYQFILEIRDLNRRSGTQAITEIDKKDKLNAFNYLVLDASKNPLYGYQKLKEGPLEIRNERNNCVTPKYFDISEEVSFPPPTFSDRNPKIPKLPEKWTLELNAFEVGHSYFLTCDEDLKKGLTISVRDPYFPNIETYLMMAKTMRYICSKNEYEYILEGVETKKKLDEFWLECGGSNDRSRQLIKTYYERIESANYFFTDIIPGWKTDRGMILVIYGKPNRIKTYKDAEVWIYGEEGNINSMNFSFYKKNSIYSNDYYELERNGDYKKSWQLAVTSWRNGRIYNN